MRREGFGTYLFNRIIGREKEKVQLHTLLDSGHRLISVVGLGGVGKTSFIRNEQINLAKRFEDGLHFVDLRREKAGGRSDLDLLLDSLVAALNLDTDPLKSLVEQIYRPLKQRGAGTDSRQLRSHPIIGN